MLLLLFIIIMLCYVVFCFVPLLHCSLSLLNGSLWQVRYERLFSQVVECAEHHIWPRRTVQHERWPLTGRSASFTKTRSRGPSTWNSWTVTLWPTMWLTQGSNALSYWVVVAPPRTTWFGVWSRQASLPMSCTRSWWRKSQHTLPHDSPGLSPDSSLTRVHSSLVSPFQLSEFCEYGETLEDMLCNRLVCGLAKQWIQERLLAEGDLTFDKALKIAQAMELAERDARDLQQAGAHSRAGVYRLALTPLTPRQDKSTKPCYRCGGSHNPSQCCFRNAVCHACERKGHIKWACRS